MGCANKPFYPTFCDFVNVDILQCHPTDTSKDKFDLSTRDALVDGYRCISGDDWREGKKRLRQSLELESLLLGE